MNFQFLRGLVLVVFCAISAPLSAAQRTALIIDNWTSATPASDFAATLREQHGFSVVLIQERSGSRDTLDKFKEWVKGSEFALVVIVGALEHDRDGTFVQLSPRPTEADVTSLNLETLVDHLDQSTKTGIVILHDVEKVSRVGTRTAGPGRLPVIDGKFIIAVANAVKPMRESLLAILSTEAQKARQQASFKAGAMLMTARERAYVESFGQNVIRLVGSLPLLFELQHPPMHSVALALVDELSGTLCKADFQESPATGMKKILAHFSSSIAGLRTATFADNDTFVLGELLRKLRDFDWCPFRAPESSPPDVDKEDKEREHEQKERLDQQKRELLKKEREEQQRQDREDEKREREQKKRQEQQRQDREDEKREREQKKRQEQQRQDREDQKKKEREPQKSKSNDSDGQKPRNDAPRQEKPKGGIYIP